MSEQQPNGIAELEQKLNKVDGAIVKANRVNNSIGKPEFGRPELDISPSSQLEDVQYLDAAIKVGRVRKALTENALPKLTDLKNQVQTQITDSKPQKEEAEKLRLIRKLVDAGHIPATVLERSQESTGVKKINNDVADRSQNREVISGDAVEEGFVVGKRVKYLNAVDLFVRTPEITLEEIIGVSPLAPNQQQASYARTYADMSRTIFGIRIKAANGSATLQELVILKRIKERIAGKSPIPVDEEAISRVFSSRVAVRNWLESEIKPKVPVPKRDTRSVAIRKVDEDVERLRKHGLKNSEIALELGIGLNEIWSSATRLIAARRIERRSPKRGEVTDVVAKRDIQIKQLINEGLNNITIAHRLGVSMSTVTTAVIRLTATGRIERNAHRTKSKRDKDTLENALVKHLSENPKKAVPLAELAREVGINSSRTFNLYQQIAKEKKVPLLRLGRSRTR